MTSDSKSIREAPLLNLKEGIICLAWGFIILILAFPMFIINLSSKIAQKFD